MLLREKSLMRAGIEAEKIAVDEVVGSLALSHADAIEAVAFRGANIIVAEEIVRPRRRDRDHLRAGRKAPHVLVVAVEANQAAAKRGGGEQRCIEIGGDAVRRGFR